MQLEKPRLLKIKDERKSSENRKKNTIKLLAIKYAFEVFVSGSVLSICKNERILMKYNAKDNIVEIYQTGYKCKLTNRNFKHYISTCLYGFCKGAKRMNNQNKIKL